MNNFQFTYIVGMLSVIHLSITQNLVLTLSVSLAGIIVAFFISYHFRNHK